MCVIACVIAHTIPQQEQSDTDMPRWRRQHTARAPLNRLWRVSRWPGPCMKKCLMRHWASGNVHVGAV
eukprot:8801358-Alexandrium_andersonii.AAC.1